MRTNPSKGVEIIKGLCGHTSGYAVPQFVIDAPNGGGNSMSPEFSEINEDGSISLINYHKKNSHILICPRLSIHIMLNQFVLALLRIMFLVALGLRQN